MDVDDEACEEFLPAPHKNGTAAEVSFHLHFLLIFIL